MESQKTDKTVDFEYTKNELLLYSSIGIVAAIIVSFVLNLVLPDSYIQVFFLIGGIILVIGNYFDKRSNIKTDDNQIIEVE